MVSRLLPVAFLVVPLVEIASFVIVGRWLGVLATLGLVVLAAAAGMAVLRRTGLKVLTGRGLGSRANSQAEAIGDGLLLAIAGVLLLIPGFVGDVIALVLLLPPVRKLILSVLAKRFNVVVQSQGFTYAGDGPERIVRTETIELEPEDWRPRS